MFSRLPNSIAISGAGPTLLRCRYFNMKKQTLRFSSQQIQVLQLPQPSEHVALIVASQTDIRKRDSSLMIG